MSEVQSTQSYPFSIKYVIQELLVNNLNHPLIFMRKMENELFELNERVIEEAR